MRIPRITMFAMLALIAAGCDNGEAASEISTDGELVADSAADDALGANLAAEEPPAQTASANLQ